MGDLREVRRLVAEVEAPSPEPEPLYPVASSVDAASATLEQVLASCTARGQLCRRCVLLCRAWAMV